MLKAKQDMKLDRGGATPLNGKRERPRTISSERGAMLVRIFDEENQETTFSRVRPLNRMSVCDCAFHQLRGKSDDKINNVMHMLFDKTHTRGVLV